MYDCEVAIEEAYRFLRESTTKPLTDLTNFAFSLDVPTERYSELVRNIEDAVALLTDDGWMRVCNQNPGHVYVLQKFFRPEHDLASEVIYVIEGSSRTVLNHTIDRLYSEIIPGPEIHEELKVNVSDCEQAVESIVDLLYSVSSTVSGIQGREGYGKNMFSVRNAKTVFFSVIQHAIFPVLLEIPPIDWLLCEKEKNGYLYIARIAVKGDNLQWHYYCDRIFGSSMEIPDRDYKIEVPDSMLWEIKRYEVQDCANAFSEAISNIKEYSRDGLWEKVTNNKDECYHMKENHYLWYFVGMVDYAINEYLYHTD